jgi:primosomal protein N' (replication factor Y)
MVCDCLVELQNVFLDKTFTYKIDSKDLDKLKVGMRVEVPFGKRFLQAFVLKIYEREDLSGLKVVKELIDDEPLLNDELLGLGKFIKDDTLSTLMSSYQVMLPKGFKAKNKDNVSSKKMKIIKLNLDIDLENIKFNFSSLKIIDFLKEHEEVFKKDLNSISISSVKTLLKKGILLEEYKVVNRFSHEYLKKELFVLNDEQQDIYNIVNNNITSNIVYLLHGVTGSGKTNIYIKLVEKVISLGKTVIILVPEISLTPQIINRFETYFDKIAVLHSGLSTGEKYDEFKRIKDGEVNIVIGARSAIFAPITNIGLIVVDEENSSTYKQDNMPRYNAIDIAFKRGEYHNCPIILGSATPSLES